MNLTGNTPSERSKSQKVTYYDPIYMTCSKRQNCRDGEEIGSYQELLAKGE